MRLKLSPFVFMFALVVGNSLAQADGSKQLIWIDSDPSCGLGATYDVDDCWAILRASNSNALKIVGISAVFGNASIDMTHSVSETLVNMINTNRDSGKLPVPVMGAKDEAQFSPSKATFELSEALSNERLIIVALGPLTNIAALIKHHPDLTKNIEKIIAVAGQTPGQTFHTGNSSLMHLHDLNFQKDTLAFKMVLESGIPVVLTPFELARQNKITEKELLESSRGDEVESWLAEISRPWLNFWKKYLGEDGFYPFDSMAIGHLIEPENISCSQQFAKVIERRSIFVNSRDILEVSTIQKRSRPVVYCNRMNQRVPIS